MRRLVQCHGDEGGKAQAQGFGIQAGSVAQNDSALFQSTDAIGGGGIRGHGAMVPPQPVVVRGPGVMRGCGVWHITRLAERGNVSLKEAHDEGPARRRRF